MAGNFAGGPDRRAGPLLASALVVFLGGFGAAIIVAAGGGDPTSVLVIFGLGVLLVLSLILLGRSTGSATLNSLYGWIGNKKARPVMDYVPRTARERRRNYGTNQPPSLEEIRDLKDSPKTWVPGRSSTARELPTSED